MNTKRAKNFQAFARRVVEHIDNYAVPQYGDAPHDSVETWTSGDCYRQVERYLKRRNTAVRQGEQRLDIMKMVHYLQLADEKLQREEAK